MGTPRLATSVLEGATHVWEIVRFSPSAVEEIVFLQSKSQHRAVPRGCSWRRADAAGQRGGQREPGPQGGLRDCHMEMSV